MPLFHEKFLENEERRQGGLYAPTRHEDEFSRNGATAQLPVSASMESAPLIETAIFVFFAFFPPGRRGGSPDEC